MHMNLKVVNCLIVGCLVLIPMTSHATIFSCDQLHRCNHVYVDKAHLTQANPEKKLENQPALENQSASVSEVTNKPQIGSLAFYLEQLQLTKEQLAALNTIQYDQKQQIISSMQILEEAHMHLRDMAIKKAYDQITAEILTNKIVNHTAKLAVLQAQREYEIFSILDESQVKRYQSLVNQTN